LLIFANKARTAAASKAYETARFPTPAFAYRGSRQSERTGEVSAELAAAEKIPLAPDDPNATAQLAYQLLLDRCGANLATAKKLQKYRTAFVSRGAPWVISGSTIQLGARQFKGPAGAPPIDWTRALPAWSLFTRRSCAPMSKRRSTPKNRDHPADRLSPEERALIEPQETK